VPLLPTVPPLLPVPALPTPLLVPAPLLPVLLPVLPLLPVLLLAPCSRQVRLTRSPVLIDFRLATALPSTGSVTDSRDDEEDEDEDEPDATGRTVIVFEVSSAAMTSAVTFPCAFDWLELSDRSDAEVFPDVLEPVEPDVLEPESDVPDVLEPEPDDPEPDEPEELDPPYGSLEEPVLWARA